MKKLERLCKGVRMNCTPQNIKIAMQQLMRACDIVNNMEFENADAAWNAKRKVLNAAQATMDFFNNN